MSKRRDQAIRELSFNLLPVIQEAINKATKTCVNCHHFEPDKEICLLANARPPIKVAVVGCEQWDEAIPF